MDFRSVCTNNTVFLYCSNGFLDTDILSQDRIRQVFDVIIVHLNACLIELRRLFLIEDYIASSKFALMLWVVRYIGTWFNGLTITIIGKYISSQVCPKCCDTNYVVHLFFVLVSAFVSAFTLPKIYENNKTQIDKQIKFVRSKIKEVNKRSKSISKD